jgi:ribosomal protein L27
MLGENVILGKDFTIHAQVAGTVAFKKGKDEQNMD